MRRFALLAAVVAVLLTAAPVSAYRTYSGVSSEKVRFYVHQAGTLRFEVHAVNESVDTECVFGVIGGSDLRIQVALRPGGGTLVSTAHRRMARGRHALAVSSECPWSITIQRV